MSKAFSKKLILWVCGFFAFINSTFCIFGISIFIASNVIWHQNWPRKKDSSQEYIFWQDTSIDRSSSEKGNKETKNHEYQRVDAYFEDWDKIRFDNKVNKISDIPENIIKEKGFANTGYVFYKGVGFWIDSKSDSIFYYDGTKLGSLKYQKNNLFESGKISRLVKNGIGHFYNRSQFELKSGYSIDFETGRYWKDENTHKADLCIKNHETTNYEDPSFLQNCQEYYQKSDQYIADYLKADFNDIGIQNSEGYSGYNSSGYEIYKNGKIYGRFSNDVYPKYTGKEKSWFIEDDGVNRKKLFQVYNPKYTFTNCNYTIKPPILVNKNQNVVVYGNVFKILVLDDVELCAREGQKFMISEYSFDGKLVQETEFDLDAQIKNDCQNEDCLKSLQSKNKEIDRKNKQKMYSKILEYGVDQNEEALKIYISEDAKNLQAQLK